MKAVRLITRMQLLDLFRNRQVWLTLFIQPFIFIFILGAIGFIAKSNSDAFRTKRFSIVISGPSHDIGPFTELLRARSFKVHRTNDIYGSITHGGNVLGVAIDPGTRDAVAHGRRGRVRLYYQKGDNQSEISLNRVRVALDEYGAKVVGTRLRAFGVDPSVTAPLAIRSTDIGSTKQGTRLLLARLLPVLVLLQSTSLVTTAAGLLSGQKDKRTLEPLLLLPLRRIDLLTGAGVAAFTIGVIPVVTFMIPVMIGLLLPSMFGGGIAPAMSVLTGLVVVGPMLAALMVGVGLFTGTLGRGGAGGSAIGGLAFVPFLGIGFLFSLVQSVPDSLPMYAVPAYGATLLMRRAIGHGFVLAPTLLVLASTIASVVLLIRLAARYLDTERSILRPSA